MRSVPAGVTFVVRQGASDTRGSGGAALASLRALRRRLGATRSTLYAFSPGGGGVCIVLWRRQSACPTFPHSKTPGVLYILSPGGPGYVNQPDDVPPAIAGVISDNVRWVKLVHDGIAHSLPLFHNAFFREIHEPADAAFTVSLRVGYADGSMRSVKLVQGAPFHLPRPARRRP